MKIAANDLIQTLIFKNEWNFVNGSDVARFNDRFGIQVTKERDFCPKVFG